ncbi:MAG: SO_0444 family Cu/Zn efflux transporter [Desulfovibrionaceae bacterium]
MPDIHTIAVHIIIASWRVLAEAAPFMLLGLAAAAALKALVPDRLVARHLGGRGFVPVLKAALLGAPLPLCSCGVTPAAAGLRRQGAGRGATAAFLVATPETGPDSVAVTWALLDPLMAVIRPVAAVLTALAAGLGVDALERGATADREPPAAPLASPAPAPAACACSGCGCAASALGASGPGVAPDAPRPPLAARLRRGLAWMLDDLLPDIGWWFLGGVAAAGLITALTPDGFLAEHLGHGLGPMLLMLALGIPLYVCATSSTPIAAALAAKGLSPGAALVFLLSGPATNAASLAVVGRILGRRATAAYLAAIALGSLGLGLAVDALYAGLGLGVGTWAAAAAEADPGPLATVCAVLLLGGIALPPLVRRMIPARPVHGGRP